MKHKNVSIDPVISSDFDHRHSQTDEQGSLFQISIDSISDEFGEMSDDHLKDKIGNENKFIESRDDTRAYKLATTISLRKCITARTYARLTEPTKFVRNLYQS